MEVWPSSAGALTVRGCWLINWIQCNGYSGNWMTEGKIWMCGPLCPLDKVDKVRALEIADLFKAVHFTRLFNI